MHLYDALAVHKQLIVRPEKAAALEGWDDLHRVTLAPTAPTEIDAGGRPIEVSDGFEPLLTRREGSMYVNHVWAVRIALRFPSEAFERLHLNVATELFERLVRPSGPDSSYRPSVFVRSYQYRGVAAPLLLWYAIHEQEVLCMLQEFLHVRFGHIPEARVWHWQLLPHHANLNAVGRAFDHAGILPSLRDLLRYALVHRQREAPGISVGELRARGGWQAEHMHTDYGRGRMAMWLGEDVFFYVTTEDPATSIANAALPENHERLPPWVMDTLTELGDVDRFCVQRNVDGYLRQFPELHGHPAQRLLRAINWPVLPLVWRPLFMRDVDVRVTLPQALDAQSRLVKSVVALWEDAETMAEAIDMLNHATLLA